MGLILKSEHGPSPTFIFVARFRPESKIYQVSQDKRYCGVSESVVLRYSCCQCKALSHLDQSIGLNNHKLSLLVNDNAAECNLL